MCRLNFLKYLLQKLPLDQFYLRNDLERLTDVIPGLKTFEIPVLEWTGLSK